MTDEGQRESDATRRDTDLTVTRDRFRELASVDGPAVVYATAAIDADPTPLSAYAALTGRTTDADRSEYAFLLESAEKVASSDPDGAFRPSVDGQRHARYSFVGYDPEAFVTLDPDGTSVTVLGDEGWGELIEREREEDDDVLDRLRRTLPNVERRGFPDRDRQLLDGGLVGFLAYEAVYDLHLDEVGVDRPDGPMPDAGFALTTRTLVFDEVDGRVELTFTPLVRPGDDPDAIYADLVAEVERVERLLASADDPSPGGFVRDREHAGSKAEYERSVRRAKEHVLDGDIYQGVISRTRRIDGGVDPLGLYASLREVNPSPYMYLLSYGDHTVVGASPETLVSVQGRRVVSNPIAGTCPRGASPVEDRRLAGEMLADGKERAEHTMLVDLARNDVRQVSEPGSVRVEEFMNVLKYSHVQHIESTVTGRLVSGYDAFDATRVTFPAGTLSGAPKIRAMEIIDDLEEEPRGLYGGGVGYYAWSGDADVAIVIRTATIEHGDACDCVTVRAGAGIVADSDPTAEYEETEKKMDGVLAALARIERDPVPVRGGATDE